MKFSALFSSGSSSAAANDAGPFNGIHNDGNSCYRNVILQALASLPLFMDHVSSQQQRSEFSKKLLDFLHQINQQSSQAGNNAGASRRVLKVPKELQILISQQPQGRQHGLMSSLTSLKSSITLFANSGSMGRQQDAHEYLQSIFEKLNSCPTINNTLSPGNNKDKNLATLNRTMSGEGLADLLSGRNERTLSRSSSMNLSASFKISNGIGPFDGLIMNLVECLVCGYVGKLVGEPFSSLVLSIGQQPQETADVDILHLLAEYFKAEVLEGYKCVKCRVKATIAAGTGVDPEVMQKLQILQAQGRYEDEDFKKIFGNGIHIESLIVKDVAKKLAHKRMFITRFPKILCLVVERYNYNDRGQMVKSETGIDLESARRISLTPMQFQVLIHRQNESTTEQREEPGPDLMAKFKEAFARSQSQRNLTLPKEYHYELECVVIHQGRTHEFGHFIAYRRAVYETVDQGKVEVWYEISDESVAPIPFSALSQYCSNNVYMLFYQQVMT